MEHTDYDKISEEYKESKLLPFRKYQEEYTLFNLAGDVTGKKVLDLACGEGIYTRKLISVGAVTATGVDLSAEMIKLAKAEEEKRPIGCDYHVSDAGSLGRVGDYDVVIASYLLNYAQTEEQLRSFAVTIYDNMKPGGHFAGYNNNPADLTNSKETYKKYGFTKETPDGHGPGGRVVYTFYNEDGTQFSLDNYFLPPELHREVFLSVGFKSFEWTVPQLDPVALQSFEKGYWDEIIELEPMAGIVAIK